MIDTAKKHRDAPDPSVIPITPGENGEIQPEAESQQQDVEMSEELDEKATTTEKPATPVDEEVQQKYLIGKERAERLLQAMGAR